jgi:hypothetical protein
MEKMRTAYGILSAKPNGKRPLGGSMHYYDIKYYDGSYRNRI